MSMKICNDKPSQCEQLEGVFSYMKDWGKGECGAVNGYWCVSGKYLVSDSDTTYYAYCVLQK